MEQYYSNDSLKAYKIEDGVQIEEKKKGTFKMLIVILGLGILVLVAGLIVGVFGSSIGRTVAPWLIWGSLLILAVATISFIIKLALNADPNITFNTTKREVSVRGKVIPFSDIEAIHSQEQPLLGKTMVFAFILIKGKKKSLFSTAIATANPKEMTEFIGSLNDLIQKCNLSDSVVNEMSKTE